MEQSDGQLHGRPGFNLRLEFEHLVDRDRQVEAPAAEARFYTVVSGDTLSKIAAEQYGNASKYPVIFEANKPMLKDPNKIYPGQNLRIPPL